MRSYLISKLAVMFVGLSLCSLLVVVSARAQMVNGSISGTVVDQTGAVVVGATVTAINTETNATINATTTSSGSFLIAGLAVGTYNVTVAKSGFQSATETGIPVTAATDHGLGSIKLTVGSSSTTVEVSAAQPLLETTQAQVSTAFTNSDMTNFPGLNANAGLDNMAVYLPGVNNPRDDMFSNSNGPGFSVNGLRSRFNDQQIDGQNNNDNSVTGPSVFVSSPLFVQEYQIITNNFGAEYGRNSGSVVDEVTKQGTNVWHGTILGTESNNYVDALSNTQIAFEDLTGPPRFNDEFTGASIGGPIWKNHLFVFGGFDNEIFSSVGDFEDGVLAPTPTGIGELQSCFPNSTAVQAFAKYSAFAIGAFNPQPGPGTTQTVPIPETGGGTCNAEMADPERVAPDGSHEYDWDYRMDAIVNDNDRFFGRYIFQRQIFFDGGDVAGGYPYNIPGFTQAILLDETHTFTPTMVNDFRVSFSRANIDFGSNSLGNTTPPASDLADALTNVTIAAPGFQGFGPPTNIPQSRILSTWQGQDNWSWLQGKNQWKAGINYTYQRTINTFFPDLNGQFTFADWAAIGANTPESVSIGTGNPVLDFREHDMFLYAGDDYKLRSNLTLNLGLTWTYFGSPENLFHTITEENETGSNPLFNPALPLSVRTFPEFPAQNDLFGPSIGFAWTPQGFGWLTGQGKTVVRGGFRMTVDPAYYNIFINMSTSTPLVLLNTITGSSAAGYALPADPIGPNVRTDLASALPVGTTDPRDYDQTTLPSNFGPDKVREWSLGIQRQINPHVVVESRYVGNHGYDLYQQANANPLVSGLAASFPNLVPAGVTPCSAANAIVPNAVGRENCNEGILDEFENTGYSDYDGWQNEVRASNLFNQLTLVGNYTWSKTTDNVSDTYSTFAGGNSIAFAQDPFNITSAEHGLSGLDFPQQFTVQGYWAVPVFRGQHGVLGHVLGGWSVGLGYQLVSGDPYTPSQEFLNYETGGDVYDVPFDAFAIGTYETARPFLGTSSAPVSQVGIYAGDACAMAGTTSTCSMAPNSLISFNAFNATGAVNSVSTSQVRYIVNGTTADSIYGTPFGNVARNSARDYHTNNTSIAVFKTFRFNERVNLQARLDMLNAFNHPNFSSIDPFIDQAGYMFNSYGFGVPQLFGDGPRVMKAGLQVNF